VQQGATLLKAHQGRRAASHPQNSRRERKHLQPQMAVARTKPTLAFFTVIVGPFQMQRSQHAFKGLPVAAMILGHPSA